MSLETFSTTEQVHNYLRIRFSNVVEEVAGRVEACFKPQFDEMCDSAIDIIDRLKLKTGEVIESDKFENVWLKFLKILSNKCSFFGRLENETIQNISKRLRTATDISETLILSLQRNFLRLGRVFIEFCSYNNERFPVRIDEIERFLMYMFPVVDQLWIDFIEGVNKLDLSNIYSSNTQGAIILRQIGNSRFVFGIRFRNGNISHVGFQQLSQGCHLMTFDGFLRDIGRVKNVVNLGEDYYSCQLEFDIDRKKRAVISRYGIAYRYPHNLFLFETGTNERWGAIDITDSNIARAIAQKLGVSIEID
jgi:hypothetical protein